MKTNKETLEYRKLYVEVLGGWLGILAVVLGGAYTIDEYTQKKEDDRIKETLKYEERLSKSPFHETQRRIDAAWLKHLKQYNEFANDAQYSPREYANLVAKVIADEEIATDVLTIADLYDSLHICVKAEVYSARTARDFFAARARIFFQTYYYWFMDKRCGSKNPTIARGLEDFLISLRPPNAKPIEEYQYPKETVSIDKTGK